MISEGIFELKNKKLEEKWKHREENITRKKKEDESIKISRETSDLLSFESSREMIYDYSRL